MPKAKPFKTEADLCAAFIAAIGGDWTAYAECNGWDILLVRNVDGFQIGVQAKLKLNAFVLAQAVDENTHGVRERGPDCRAVLVPAGEMSVGITFLCAYVGVTVIRMTAPNPTIRGTRIFEPPLPKGDGRRWEQNEWFERAIEARCKLPEYLPDVPAGVKSPSTLSDWKIGALKIEAIIEARGFVTRDDFRVVGIDYRRWVSPGTGWLMADGKRYVAGRRFPDFKKRHPVVFEKIKADSDKWMPRERAGELKQGALL